MPSVPVTVNLRRIETGNTSLWTGESEGWRWAVTFRSGFSIRSNEPDPRYNAIERGYNITPADGSSTSIQFTGPIYEGYDPNPPGDVTLTLAPPLTQGQPAPGYYYQGYVGQIATGWQIIRAETNAGGPHTADHLHRITFRTVGFDVSADDVPDLPWTWEWRFPGEVSVITPDVDSGYIYSGFRDYALHSTTGAVFDFPVGEVDWGPSTVEESRDFYFWRIPTHSQWVQAKATDGYGRVVRYQAYIGIIPGTSHAYILPAILAEEDASSITATASQGSMLCGSYISLPYGGTEPLAVAFSHELTRAWEIYRTDGTLQVDEEGADINQLGHLPITGSTYQELVFTGIGETINSGELDDGYYVITLRTTGEHGVISDWTYKDFTIAGGHPIHSLTDPFGIIYAALKSGSNIQVIREHGGGYNSRENGFLLTAHKNPSIYQAGGSRVFLGAQNSAGGFDLYYSDDSGETFTFMAQPFAGDSTYKKVRPSGTAEGGGVAASLKEGIIWFAHSWDNANWSSPINTGISSTAAGDVHQQNAAGSSRLVIVTATGTYASDTADGQPHADGTPSWAPIPG